MRYMSFVNKVKDSFEPDSNQRPKDSQLHFYSPPLYQLSYRRKVYDLKCLKGRKLFHGKSMHLRGFTKFRDSFLFKRGEEDNLQGISKKQIEIVSYAAKTI